MKIKICRVWNQTLDEYKDVLNKYNPTYEIEEGKYSNDYYAIVEVKTPEQIFQLRKELGIDLIIQPNEILIYDSYIE